MVINKSIIFTSLLVLSLCVQAKTETYKTFTNLQEAKTEASLHHKSILMVFAGSDWCRPCIQFERGILSNSTFTSFADKSLVVLYLDFPSLKKNKLSEEQTKHNEQLAEKYNTNGAFPNILMFDENEKPLGKLSFHNQTPDQFVAECSALIPQPTLSEEHLVPAKKIVKLMGCRFEITAVAVNDTIAWLAIERGIEEISRIERLISSWDTNSQTSRINQFAGLKPVVVDQELFDLVYRAKKVTELTQGAFDISFASMDAIWDFNGQEQTMPDSLTVADAKAKIRSDKVKLDKDSLTVFLEDKGMKIGFGAIGKGYAADQAKLVMSQIAGVRGGLVNASGDLMVWGESAKPNGWVIQIANPKDNSKSLGSLTLEDMAIVTSGDYEKYFTNQGVRYAHIINPKTGYPTTGVKSVSIICANTEAADALATSVFVLGKDEGLALINQLDNIECIVVTTDDELFTSDNLKLNYY